MTLWTPAFQRSESCGDRSPKPVTTSLMVSNRVVANGVPRRGRDDRIAGRPLAAIRRRQRDGGLTAENRRRERVRRGDRCQIFRRDRDGAHVFIDRGPSNSDQAGARDLAAGRREGEAGLRRRRREAPERPRSPEALPDFIRRRKLWS